MKSSIKYASIIFIYLSCCHIQAAEVPITPEQAKPEQQPEPAEKARVESAIKAALTDLLFRKTVKDFGERFRFISTSLADFSSWENKKALLTAIVKSDVDNYKKIASLCEAELSLGMADGIALAFIHSLLRDLYRANIMVKNLPELVRKAYKQRQEPAKDSIKDYLNYLFTQSENQSQYLVYAAVRALVDSAILIDKNQQLNYLADIEEIVLSLRDLPFNDSLMQQWIIKTSAQIKERFDFQMAFYKEAPEQICFRVINMVQKSFWARDWDTLRPLIEELFENKFYDKNLMILFALETAKKRELIQGLSDEWIDKQVRNIPFISKSAEILENVCRIKETIDDDTHEMARCLPVLKSKLRFILDKDAFNIPFIYGLIKNILTSNKLSMQLKAFCLGTIGDYYSEHNLWGKLTFQEAGTNPQGIDFGRWIKEQIYHIDPVAWLAKIRPEIFTDLPIELDQFKDAIRSLFTLDALKRGFAEVSKKEDRKKLYDTQAEYTSAILASVFRCIRIIAIGRVLGFIYRLYWADVPGKIDLRTTEKFVSDQPYFYLTNPEQKDRYWSLTLEDAYFSWEKAHPEAYFNKLREVVKHYKIHLMPKEEKAEKCAVDLMTAIKKNKELENKVIIFKILCNPDRMLREGEAPRIVIYVTGRSNAQDVLNIIFKLFGPGGPHQYEGCGRAPGFNQRVTDLIFFAQGDRNMKVIEEYARYFEPDKIYYAPTILPGGEHDFKLKIPAVH